VLHEGLGYIVRTTRLESGERFALLLDARDGMPLPWPTRYSAVFRRTHQGSVSTMEQELRALALAFSWADERRIDLDERIGSASFLSPEEVLGLRDALRTNLKSTSSSAAVDPTTHYNRCIYVRDYIVWRGQHVVQRIPNVDARFLPARIRLQEFQRSMGVLLLKPKPREREGMPPAAAERLREVLHPGHPGNPFQPGQRHRNRALVLFYLDLGVRLSEALVVKGADLRLDGSEPTVIVHRRPDDPEDPRSRQPLTKTQSRVLPLGKELRDSLAEWVLHHRCDARRYPGAKRVPYVFVARNGRPISIRAVTDIFATLKRVPGLPPDLSAHVLRHTWNDAFSRFADESGMEEADEMRTRNYLMGWKKHSTSSTDYTKRHTREEAQKRSLQMQERSAQGKNR